MKKMFYQRLAFTNIKKNAKTYLPFILTCVGTVLMFYNMAALTFHADTGDGTTYLLMSLGMYTTGIFSVIFIFYTNSFLVKRRKKEFGLFNILGMEKKHIGRVMMWETIIVFFISIIIGLVSGIIFNKLATLLLFKLMSFKPPYGFQISTKAIVITTVLFLGIFILNLLNSLWQVKKSKPIELLQGGNVGEKEPKSNWFIAIVGLLTLGTGYYIALTIDDIMAVIFMFFVAVILVIIGTYCLFTAGSVVFLKLLRKNKSYYYKTNHFVSLSSMIYRMKKNAVGLANICIMSTAVLVMVSTTVSLYAGIEDTVKYAYPNDVSVTVGYDTDNRVDTKQMEQSIKDILKQDNMEIAKFKGHEYLTFTTNRDGNSYGIRKDMSSVSASEISNMMFISAKDYKVLYDKEVTLKSDEVVMVSNRESEEIDVLGKTFKVKENVKISDIQDIKQNIIDMVCVVVSDYTVIDEIYTTQKKLYDDNGRSIYYQVGFDFKENNEQTKEYAKTTFVQKVREIELIENRSIQYDIKELQYENFYTLYGGLFFLGIFLGFLFLIAMVLIIYYKQVVEGFEDKERFRIMRNVGMSRSEVKKSIGSQVLTVFAIPILVAVIHIVAAFPILTMMLQSLNLTNIPLFAICMVCTVIVFAIIYIAVYIITSKVYYKIVDGK